MNNIHSYPDITLKQDIAVYIQLPGIELQHELNTSTKRRFCNNLHLFSLITDHPYKNSFQYGIYTASNIHSIQIYTASNHYRIWQKPQTHIVIYRGSKTITEIQHDQSNPAKGHMTRSISKKHQQNS